MLKGQTSVPIPVDTGSNPWEAGGASGCVGAYIALGADSLAASYINLANPGTNNLTLGVAPGWSAVLGWQHTGTQYMKTGIVPTSREWTYIVSFADAASGNGWLLGSNAPATAQVILQPNNATLGIRAGNDGTLTALPGMTGGVLAIAGAYVYKNGVQILGPMANWTGVKTVEDIWIGTFNPLSGGAVFNGKIQAVFIYDNVLSAGKVAAVSSAIPGSAGITAGDFTYGSSID